MNVSPRLRQVALVAARLAPVADALQRELGLGEPYHDGGVAEFGLENAVFPVGDTFIEVVAPTRAETAAGRYLDKRGGDGGYMAIFQVGDVDEARRRVADLGVRTVWTADLADIAGTHLHPKDVPGAIVSLDWADPPGSWRWAGPAWTGGVPEHGAGGIRSLTVSGGEPGRVARCWASVLSVEVGSGGDDLSVSLDEGRQTLRFVTSDGPGPVGISEVTVALARPARPARHVVDIGGVRFVVVPIAQPARP